MRRILAVLAVALIAGMATSSFAATAHPLAFPITIIISADEFMLDGNNDPVGFGTAAWSASVFSNSPGGQPRSTAEQVGWASPVDFQAVAAVTTGAWNLVSPAVGVGNNNAVMYGVFTRALVPGDSLFPENERLVAAGDFDATDSLEILKTASYTQLAIDSESNTIAVKGRLVYNTNATRSMRYRLDTPTGGDLTEQTITVTLSLVNSI